MKDKKQKNAIKKEGNNSSENQKNIKIPKKFPKQAQPQFKSNGPRPFILLIVVALLVAYFAPQFISQQNFIEEKISL